MTNYRKERRSIDAHRLRKAHTNGPRFELVLLGGRQQCRFPSVRVVVQLRLCHDQFHAALAIAYQLNDVVPRRIFDIFSIYGENVIAGLQLRLESHFTIGTKREKRIFYLSHTRTALGDKAHYHRLLASRHETETHRWIPLQHHRSRHRRRLIAISLRSLECCRFIQMTVASGCAEVERKWSEIKIKINDSMHSLDPIKLAIGRWIRDGFLPPIWLLYVWSPVLGRR